MNAYLNWLNQRLKDQQREDISNAFRIPMQEDMQKEAVKWDDNKVRMDLLPPRPIEDIAEVFTFGAKKYSDRNWELGFKYGRPFAALLRHLFAWWRGEDNDKETGMSHLAHAGCCLFMLMEYRHSGKGEDDRPT